MPFLVGKGTCGRESIVQLSLVVDMRLVAGQSAGGSYLGVSTDLKGKYFKQHTSHVPV